MKFNITQAVYTYERIDGMLWADREICINNQYITQPLHTEAPIKYVIGESMTQVCAEMLVQVLGGTLIIKARPSEIAVALSAAYRGGRIEETNIRQALHPDIVDISSAYPNATEKFLTRTR